MLPFVSCVILPAARDATPEQTLKSTMDALSRSDWKGMFSHVKGAKVDLAAQVIEKQMKGQTIPAFSLSDIQISFSGADASGTCKIKIGNNPAEGPYPVTLHQDDGDWKIVGGKGMFAELVSLGQDPEQASMRANSAAQNAALLSTLKQLALSVLLYANDHDGKYALQQSTLKAKLMPYLKNEKLWIGPDGKPLDVRINPNLIGKLDTSVAAPAQTVLLTLGPKSSLVYIKGRTPVAFVDGHVKLLSKEAAATLKW